ncbi:hypothetical protein [Citrobacter sp. FDAARGOS_156]|uniref:hypothetical protein n=1 Tax=Citrobacter sp. FDAARGOS_156 TaxID=1702170 RepID=UPI000AFE9D7B|nr:hypothetical protein [Citrobacter sp. FDAARGOS_156]
MKRNHEITVAADGLITIVGGKLTTSRHMAEETIDAASKILGRKKACSTKTAWLLGARAMTAGDSGIGRFVCAPGGALRD